MDVLYACERTRTSTVHGKYQTKSPTSSPTQCGTWSVTDMHREKRWERGKDETEQGVKASLSFTEHQFTLTRYHIQRHCVVLFLLIAFCLFVWLEMNHSSLPYHCWFKVLPHNSDEDQWIPAGCRVVRWLRPLASFYRTTFPYMTCRNLINVHYITCLTTTSILKYHKLALICSFCQVKYEVFLHYNAFMWLYKPFVYNHEWQLITMFGRYYKWCYKFSIHND